MNQYDLTKLLNRVASGDLEPEKAVNDLLLGPFAALTNNADVCLDAHRLARTGLEEAVFGPGKSLAQLETCVKTLTEAGRPALATKLSDEQGTFLALRFPQGHLAVDAGLFLVGADFELDERPPASGKVMVVTAGASDMPVAWEAYVSARYFGLDAGLAGDMGVAGIHRLSPHVGSLRQADVIIVAAGMEGALPSVVAGLTDSPVIAVPTSGGYGAAFGGVAALLGMLTSCSPGVSVMNIDNGFGAAAVASKIMHRIEKNRQAA